MAAKHGKFEVGKIYYQYFEYRGQMYIIPHLFRDIRKDGQEFLDFVPVKASGAAYPEERAYQLFLTWDELCTVMKDMDYRPRIVVGSFLPHDFS